MARKFAFGSSSRGPRLLLLLGTIYAASCLAPVTAQSVEVAFKEHFGAAAANETARALLLSQLDTLIELCGAEPGQLLKNVHEYDDPAARKIGRGAVELTATNVDAWADKVLEALPELDETQSFAMLRRCVVGALLRVWLQQGEKLPGDEGKLTELMNKLYDTHRLGAVRKGVMEYMHISKSGGTTWCHIAQLNGCRTERYDEHYVCMIKRFDDKVRWLNKSFHESQVPAHQVPKYVLRRFSRFGSYRKDHEVASCAERHKHIHLNDYNYYSNEYCVHGGHSGPADAHLCRDFFNAILMRNPRNRLVSHMKFVMWTMSGQRGYNDTRLFNMMYGNRTSRFWQALGPAVVDNYFIRSLLGEEVFHAPVGGITDDMLKLAKQVLVQFDLLMVLEQPVNVRNLILYYGVGWKHTLEEVHDKDSSVREAQFDTSPYIPKDVNWLLDQQAKDMDLYAFSMTVAALDPVVYSVAKGQGLVPLPELAAASDKDNLHCGLLRGLNGTKLLETIGSGRAATGAAASGAGVKRHSRKSRRSRARVLQQLVMKQAGGDVLARYSG